MIELESQQLRFREVEVDDLPMLLPVYLSNPEFVMWNEGSQGEQGHYDLEMLQRDWQVAQMMPSRCMLGIYLKATGEAVGQADYLEENPDDGKHWLGLLMIHSAHQRLGLGSEAYQRLAGHFRADKGWTTLRLGVLRQNTKALAFWQHLGFYQIGATRRDNAGRHIVLMEHQLSS